MGETATIKAEDVSLPYGGKMTVSLTGTSVENNAFTLKSAEGATIGYTIKNGETPVNVGDTVLTVEAGNASGATELTFTEPDNVQYSGEYTGTVTFTVAAALPATFIATVDTALEEMTVNFDDGTEQSGGEAQAEQPTRFFAQAVRPDGGKTDVITGTKSGDGITFAFPAQESDTAYTYLFWADNATGDAPTDLTAVPYTAGTAAYAATASGTAEQNITLTPVVTKVTLQHSGEKSFEPKDGDALTVTFSSAEGYNVQQGASTGTATQTVTKNYVSDETIASGTDICHFYVLAPSDANDVDISFRTHHLTISGISMPADTRIILSGDLSSNSDKWELTEAQRKEAFESCFFDENGDPKGQIDVGDYIFYSDQSTVERFFNEILGMPKGTYLQPINLFGYTITCIDLEGHYVTFYVNDITFVII